MFNHVNVAPTLSDQVTNALLARIESGQLKAGEKLPREVVLAPEFGVSRTVIREAISRLKHEGLVESRQGSGVFVRAQPVPKRNLREWRRLPAIDEDVAARGDGVAADVEFHRVIAEATEIASSSKRSTFLPNT
jgi:GntR family transcriptional regulator, transcriptional repressor for pyruvate dehydrogenase complex